MSNPDGGGSLEVTPQRLTDTAPLFHKASQDTTDLVHNLNKTSQQLITDMSAELSSSPPALQILFSRWQKSMASLSTALGDIGNNLDTAAQNYKTTDHNVSNSLTPQHSGGPAR